MAKPKRGFRFGNTKKQAKSKFLQILKYPTFYLQNRIMLTKIPEMIKMADSREQALRSFHELLIRISCPNITKKGIG
jgi:hypothetical protein